MRDNLFSLLQLQNVKENFYRSKPDVRSVKNSSVLSISSLLPLQHCFKPAESRGFFPPLSEVLIYIISFVTHDFRKINYAILIKITVNYLTLHLLKGSF